MVEFENEKMNSVDISIVIPVYNVERYIERCLNSIFNQEFAGTFEVIAVNDASPDRSLEILKQYQLIESRLIVLEHHVNRKLSVSRKTGIKAATGKYIMHVDSDDWLLPGALQDLHNKCKLTNADIIVFNYSRGTSETSMKPVNRIKNEIINKEKTNLIEYFTGACWNKIVKRDVLQDLIYGNYGINNGEDLLYSIEILLRAKSICLVPKNYYVYFVNDKSISNTLDPISFFQNHTETINELYKIIYSNNANSAFCKKLFLYYQQRIYLMLTYSWLNGNKKLKNEPFVEAIEKFPSIEDKYLSRIKSSFKNRLFCFIGLIQSFGIYNSLSIIITFCKMKFKNCVKFYNRKS